MRTLLEFTTQPPGLTGRAMRRPRVEQRSTVQPVRLLQLSALVSSLDRAAIAPLLVPIAADFSRSVDQATLAARAPSSTSATRCRSGVRPSALADLATAIAAGFALGTLGAAVLGELVSWRFAFVVTGVFALLLDVLMAKLPEPLREPSPKVLSQIPGVVRLEARC